MDSAPPTAVYVRAAPPDERLSRARPARGGKLLQYLLGHAVDAPAVGRDHDVGDFAVQRRACIHEVRKSCRGIAAREQRTLPAIADALGLLCHGSLQIDDAAALTQQAAVLRQQHRTAAGCQHDALEGRKRLDRLALALAEARFALLVEDEGDVDTRAPLDLGIAVVKGQTQRAGKVAADGRLARAHRADEKYAGLAEHPG